MLPRPGSIRGTPEDGRARPHGWNVMTDKDLLPEVLRHHSLRKSRGSGSRPCASTGRFNPAKGIAGHDEQYCRCDPDDVRGVRHPTSPAVRASVALGSAMSSPVLSNMFQPADSRFAAGWQCTFSISMRGRRCDGEVALPIAERAAFADFTSWPRLMIVNDHRIVSPDGTTIGYATPKYFETSCPGEVGR